MTTKLILDNTNFENSIKELYYGTLPANLKPKPDVVFVVKQSDENQDEDKNQIKIKAHKFPLSLRSTVFNKMFNDDKTKFMIAIDDTDAHIFSNLLK